MAYVLSLGQAASAKYGRVMIELQTTRICLIQPRNVFEKPYGLPHKGGICIQLLMHFSSWRGNLESPYIYKDVMKKIKIINTNENRKKKNKKIKTRDENIHTIHNNECLVSLQQLLECLST